MSRGLAACAVAGLALWLTRASLDVAAGPDGEVRVAMFPSWVELPALIVFVLILVLLGATLLERLLPSGARGPAAGLPVDPLLPLFSLLVLALPYVPWLPDRVPALRALGGPASLVIWAIVIGQVAWMTWEALGHARSRGLAPPRSIRRGTMAVLVVTLAGLGAAAATLIGSQRYPAADEAHTLVVAQSLVLDGDLRVDNNYQREDYRAYFNGPLTPEAVRSGRSGAIYPGEAIGLSMLVTPAYAIGGYRAVTIALIVVSALGAVLAWLWAARVTASRESATLAWLVVAGSAPFVLHSFAVSPEVTAGVIALAAVAWLPRGDLHDRRLLLVSGIIIGVLPWLGARYVPLSVALVSIVAARQRDLRTALVPIAAYVVMVAAWLGHFQLLWGTLSPTAPLVDPPDVAARYAVMGMPALWFDQEYGVLPYAPALLLAFPGLWLMWRAGGTDRRHALEIAAAFGVVLVTAAASVTWWGGTHAPPGRALVVGLLLLAAPIAWWDRHVARAPLKRATGRVLALGGVAITATLVLAQSGLLIANRRDGSSQLLTWLAPSHDLVRLVPSYIAQPPVTAVGLTVGWVIVIAVTALVLRRTPQCRAAIAAPAALLLAFGACTALAIAARLTLESRLASRVPAAAQAESPLLATFDTRQRPSAIVYDPWRRLPSADVPPLFRFEGRPGLRRAPQPLRVLLNTRLNLPAGDYDVELRPDPATVLDGPVAVQVGRMGEPLETWQAHAAGGAHWSGRFRLDVDASFVGFRTTPDVERAVDAVIVRPVSVANANERLDRHLRLPPVLAASRYGGITAYFHGSDVYPERTGFWVRGGRSAIVTFALAPDVDASTIQLRLHPGAAANRVRLTAGTWQTTLELGSEESTVVQVPIVPSIGQVALRIAPESGFVPAELVGGQDRRRLGCWVEPIDSWR